MGAITNTKYDARQTDGFTEIHLTTESGDSSDTTTVDLSTYGASEIVGILGFVETTAGSVVAQEQPTTAVSSGTLTITVGGSSVTSKVRNYIVYAR